MFGGCHMPDICSDTPELISLVSGVYLFADRLAHLIVVCYHLRTSRGINENAAGVKGVGINAGIT